MSRTRLTPASIFVACFLGLFTLSSLTALAWAHTVPAQPLAPLSADPLTLVWSSAETDDILAVAWGDVDGDGDLDLAVANFGGPNRLYRNDDGVLTANAVWSSLEADLTRSLAWGDVDNDGDLDLVFGNESSPNRLYRNDNGTLTTNAVWSSTESEAAFAIAWADVDSDGDLDLAVGNGDPGPGALPNRLYRNDNGVLTASAVWSSTEAEDTTSIAWGDMDNDGDPDLAVGNYYGEPNRIYRNEGGTLTASGVWTSTESDDTTSVAWGDVDGDGRLDLAVGNSGQPNRLYYNDENAGTLLTTAFWSSTDNMNTTSIVWGDMDGDGDLDLFAGTEGAPNRIYRNDSGALTPSAAWLSNESDRTESIALGDMDGDGDLDLAVGNRAEPNRVYRNNSSLFAPTAAWSSVEINRAIYSVTWGDVDGDGDLDLAVGNGSHAGGQGLQLYRNNYGVLSANPVWWVNANSVQSVAWGDVDRDGDLDLAAGDAQFTRLYRNDSGVLTLGTVWLSAEITRTYSLAWGDVDGDGDLDLAAGGWGNDRLYRNDNGLLTANAVWSSTENDESFSMAWGDVDDDGDLDLVTGNLNQPTRLYRNDQGVLTTSAVWSSTRSDFTTSVAWADVDGDGDLDLAVGNAASPSRLYRNDHGVLTTSAVWSSTESNYTTGVAWGDVDGDGDPDLAMSTRDAQTRLYRNDHGVLSANASWSSAEANVDTSALALGDMDGDGDLDLMTAGFQALRLYRNTRNTYTFPGAVPRINLMRPAPPANADFYSSPHIWADNTLAINYTLADLQRQAVAQVNAFYSLDGGGQWSPALAASGTLTHDLATSPTGIPYTYTWDIAANGLFGQFDNVVFRLEAIPSTRAMQPNPFPNEHRYGQATAQTFPFRVRGTQIRVLSATLPLANALVYRLPVTATGSFEPITDASGTATRTNTQGYLQGRGALASGDRLIALYPISATRHYSLYNTSAAPTLDGLSPYTVTQSGVQTLTVSATRPLVLLNLDVSLEWDARNDTDFLNNLSSNFQRTAQILYDLTNGQLALGDVRIYHAKENWLDADLVLYASNGIRPNANMGGAVLTPTLDLGVTGVISPAYVPGQVRLGPNWNRFGALTTGDLGEDWARALAHELGHYALFQPDNYLGFDTQGLLINPDCRGSVMTNAYDESYSEFLPRAGWTGDCLLTLAEHTTGRTDWESIRTFYPFLASTPANAGPNTLPLAVTHVSFVTPPAPPRTLANPLFDLHDESGTPLILPPNLAEAFLIKTKNTPTLTDDHIIALGAPYGGLVRARGAEPGDTLCVYDYSVSPTRSTCEPVGTSASALTLHPLPDWNPQITSYPVSSTLPVLAITVTVPTPTSNLFVQFMPSYSLTNTFPLTGVVAALQPAGTLTFTQVITLPYPAYDGYFRVWQASANPPRETLTQFSLGYSWAANRSGFGANRSGFGANRSGFGANRSGFGAPVSSSDGTVYVFTPADLLGDTSDYTLQVIPRLATLPSWFTPAGALYRFTATQPATRTIAFNYLQRDVPPGYEFTLNIYYSPDAGATWQRLPTRLEPADNFASARLPSANNGSGLYVLVATLELPPLYTGWNQFSYPLPGTRSVTTTLASIDDAYTSVYYNVPNSPAWRLHDQTVVRDHPAFAPLVNDLLAFEFARSYWLYATHPVTPYIGVPTNSPFTPPYLPPMTVYGWITPTTGFTVTLGLPVTARINGLLCGQTTVVSLNTRFAYKLVVSADNGNGCGAAGRTVVFSVGTRALANDLAWDNSEAQYHALDTLATITPTPTPTPTSVATPTPTPTPTPTATPPISGNHVVHLPVVLYATGTLIVPPPHPAHTRSR